MSITNFPCTLCGSRDWPRNDTNCPLCQIADDDSPIPFDHDNAPDGYIAVSAPVEGDCGGCVFLTDSLDSCLGRPCLPWQRRDESCAIFKLKQP